MSEPQLPNKVEGKTNYESELDFKKLYESDMEDEGGLI